MAVTLTGTSSGNQGLFDRIGRFGYVVQIINTFRGAYASGSLPTEVVDALAYFDGGNDVIRGTVRSVLDGLSSQQAAMGTLPGVIRAACQQCLIEMFDQDAPLATKDVETALEKLKRQMLTATTRYVEPNTIGATVTQTSLVGTGVLVASVLDGSGYQLDNLLAEVLLVTVTDNSIAGSEVLRVRGEAAVGDKLSHLWPAGSGAAAQYSSIDASGAANLLGNGDLEDFTDDVPDGWEVVVGTPTTHMAGTNSIKFAGSWSLDLIGDGSTLTQIRQQLGDLDPKTPYAVNCWVRKSTAAASGTLVLDLFDGSSVINDEAGNANSISRAVSAMTTSFVPLNGFFRLPEPLPTEVYLRIRFSSALGNTEHVYLDHLAMAAAEQPVSTNPGGVPYLAVFSGAVNWSLDDGAGTSVFKCVTANDRASAWQEMFDRLFDTAAVGYVLPTAGTTIVNDNLIG